MEIPKMISTAPDKDYIITIRRELHRIPEIGFELPKTLAVIRRELDAMGIEYTEKFGRSSIVGYIGRGKGRTLALRADIDALPIKENTGLPYSSEHDGMMHACGHDAHAAILLGTAKMLKASEDELPCEVRLFFQAGEETPPGGAIFMCEDGCMEGVEAVLGLHVSPMGVPGKILFNYGETSACSRRFIIKLHGKTSHAAAPRNGIDAIAMAYKVYSGLQLLRAREVDPKRPVILNVGTINGGSAANNVCGEVEMTGTVRTLDDETGEIVIGRIREICESAASDMGGRAEVITPPYYPAVINDRAIAERLKAAAIEALGEDMVYDELEPSLGGEDFAHFAKIAPAAYFRLGTRLGNVKAVTHNEKMVLDDERLVNGALVYRAFINGMYV